MKSKKATPRLNKAMSDERAWKIAQLAAMLVQNKLPQSLGNLSNLQSPMATEAWDHIYAAALKRADTLLNWAEGKGGDVHAYQLFTESEILTEAKIAQRFQAYNWRAMSAKNTVTSLMRNVKKRFDDAIKTAEQDAEVTDERVMILMESIEEGIDSAFVEYADAKEKEVSEWLSSFWDELKTKVRENISVGLRGQFRAEFVFALEDEKEFLARCFPPPEKHAQVDRRYLVYDIFKHCASKGWEREKLVRRRDEITGIPNPSVYMWTATA